MPFDWDENKNLLNIEKHGLDFEDSKELFLNGSLWKTEDKRSEYKEVRFVGFGYVKNRLMNIVFTKRIFNIIRIISFRKANQREVEAYEKNFKN
jgi:uncharacterized DUF497 family protein